MEIGEADIFERRLTQPTKLVGGVKCARQPALLLPENSFLIPQTRAQDNSRLRQALDSQGPKSRPSFTREHFLDVYRCESSFTLCSQSTFGFFRPDLIQFRVRDVKTL